MNGRPGAFLRFLRWLTTPSARYSVLTLVGIGLIIGAGGILGSAVMIHATGTDEFCATACHERGGMAIPAREWMQSPHYANRSGVRAGCSDCHIPHTYPAKLIRKAQAGMTDAYHTVLGTISTPEKYEAHRWRMANQVWADMRRSDSAECRYCHDFTPEALAVQAKENEVAAQMHKSRKEQGMTCIDCHKGIAHQEPDDPAEKKAAPKAAPAEPAKADAPAAAGGAAKAEAEKPVQVAAGEKHPPVEAKPEQLQAVASWLFAL